jgi:hypothetical protein
MPLKTNTARKPTSCLSRQNTLANAMAREPYSCLSRQQRLASQLHASQDKQTLANAMARKPNKCTVIPNLSTTASIRCTQANILTYTQPVCVFSVSRCAFCLDHIKPIACAGSSQCHTAFQKPQALSLASSFPVSWLLPDPGSFAFPSLARFQALSDPLVPCSWLWVVWLTAGGAEEEEEEEVEGGRRCGLRRAAQEVGRRRRDDGGRCGLRLPGAVC